MTGYEFILWVLAMIFGTILTLFIAGVAVEYVRTHPRKDNDK